MNSNEPEPVASIAPEVERYLATGDCDPLFRAWPGHTLARCQAGEATLRQALILEVRRRTDGLPAAQLPPGLDFATFVREKLRPMVTGLFPDAQRELLLDTLQRGVYVLTSDNIESILRDTPWISTAWTLADMYLRAAGARPLGPNAEYVVGLSEETTSYVTVAYFREDDPFADFIVHEAAHVFHNCKRDTIGLPGRKRQEWLLDIDYAKRETFAYACEAYSRLLEMSPTPAARRASLRQLLAAPAPPDERVDAAEYQDILAEASADRNGWKRIAESLRPSANESSRDAAGVRCHSVSAQRCSRRWWHRSEPGALRSSWGPFSASSGWRRRLRPHPLPRRSPPRVRSARASSEPRHRARRR